MMKRGRVRVKLLNLFLCTGVSLGAVARAELGGHESNLDEGRRNLVGADHDVTSTDKYRVHRTTVAGTTVREYADTGGNIFLIRWEGQTQPDLTKLLGQYFEGYRDERRRQPKAGGRQAVEINSSDMVVHHSGHMGAIRGEAYLKSRVPVGLTIGDVP